MSSRIVIRYRGAGAPLAWLAEDERGRVLAGPYDDTPIPAATLAGAREIVVLVPGEEVLLAETRVAARSREQLAKAIPYALEDLLAEPVEALQFALIADAAGGQRVAVVRRERMTEWLADLAQRGIRPDALISEASAMPVFDDAPCVLLEADRAIVRFGATRVLVAAREDLAAALARSDAARDAAGRPLVHVFDVGGAGTDFGEVAAIDRVDLAHALPLLARGLRAYTAPNLLSGAFAPRHQGDSARRAWQLAAMLAGALVVLGGGYAIIERVMLGNRARDLDAQMRAVYREAFPAATRLAADVKGQMQGELNRMRIGGQGAGVLPLLQRVAPVVTNGTQHTLEGIEFRNGTLELVIRAPAVAALDALRESAATVPGVRVELASATTTERGAEGRLRITEATP